MMPAASWRQSLIAALIGILGGGAAVGIASHRGLLGGGANRAAVEGVVHDYLLENPEILPQAMRVLAAREAGKAADAHRTEIERPYAGAWAGAERGDVVLVEFFDYACGFCRASNADIERLLREDEGLKVVWREYPVLGPDSLAAAEASLAAAQAGQFKQFHDSLFEQGRPSADTIAGARATAGVSGAPNNARAEIENNYRLAAALGASGTPTFVVGDKVLQGAVGYDALKGAIAEAREKS